ncbi:EthD family reductase [Microbacterium sp. NPDC077644]|uniref:EthD family reductase n=1 Tax=Microbacterium sp. NPDC077644 TaxID=3155055 RepID=UPI00344C74F1
MSYRVTIAYRQPTDPAAFDAYYRDTHLALAAQIPDVVRFTAGRADSPDGEQPYFYQLAEVVFDSREKALAALASPAGKAAADDIPNFADNGAAMFFSEEEVRVP